MAFSLILKIGGSIFENTHILDQFLEIFFNNVNPFMRYIVIVGGGDCANQLREQYLLDSEKEKLEEEYHWKAIKCMDMNAIFVKKRMEKIFHSIPVILLHELSTGNMGRHGIYVLQLSQDLMKEDPIQHSWSVSSDSIALYYTHRFNCSLCVLVKNNPYLIINKRKIQKISANVLLSNQFSYFEKGKLGKGIVDPLAPHLCNLYNTPILILNGADEQDVFRFFTAYTIKNQEIDLSSFGILIYPGSSN